MKISAVTVSVNYSDFLCWTLLHNQGLFDEWIIVTSPEDKKTQKLVEHYDKTLIVTDEFYTDGAVFNKWKGINRGLQYTNNEWILFLDSDVILPPQSKRVLDSISLNTKNIYGVDRIDFKRIEDLLSYIQNPDLYSGNWLLNPYENSARIVHLRGQQGDGGKFGGYKPLGFFQLVHVSSFKDYPQDSSKADHCDVQFANQYPRENRVLIPEFTALHLMSEDHWGINWGGRKSKEFRLYHDA